MRRIPISSCDGASSGALAGKRPSSFRRSGLLLRLTRVAAGIVLPLLFRTRIDGLLNVPRKGAFVLLPKHQRWEDVPLLGLAVPRPLYYVAKQELFRNPLLRWLMTSLGGIPLNRMRPLESRPSLREVMELLRSGEGVVVFPEGTYYKGLMGPGRKGLIRMIRNRVKVPYIPVGVQYGAGGIPKPVRISFGRPVPEDPGMEEEAFYDLVLGEIARLSKLEKPDASSIPSGCTFSSTDRQAKNNEP